MLLLLQRQAYIVAEGRKGEKRRETRRFFFASSLAGLPRQKPDCRFDPDGFRLPLSLLQAGVLKSPDACVWVCALRGVMDARAVDTDCSFLNL